MTSITFFLILVPVLAAILLAVNLILAPHSPYQEKDSAFECGFHSFLGQNRTQFSISFFIFGLLFLLFDLEILLVLPSAMSLYLIEGYGIIVMLIFFLLLTAGFAFELGKNALKIDSRQNTKSQNSVALPLESKVISLAFFKRYFTKKAVQVKLATLILSLFLTGSVVVLIGFNPFCLSTLNIFLLSGSFMYIFTFILRDCTLFL